MRLIDADLLEEHFKKVIKHYEKGESSLCETKCKLLEGAFRDVLARIKGQPTVDERPKAKWIYNKIGYPYIYTCSECGYHNDIRNRFCPYCGADMRGE